ncbi:MAG: D-aminoacyl-tRNA deacylase [Candidatus Thermoplasmatota archaeon]|nr:D-aminoacyl-tRNA deacylase [Candidatus Thermoplasmatota archaeon]
MKLIVTSSEDNASMNIRGRLLEVASWQEHGTFEGRPALSYRDFVIIQAARMHLEEDDIDLRAKAELGNDLEVVIFASRHRSEKRIPTLTVHPIGNYASADYGGKPGTLCPTAPHLMTSALRNLKRNAAGLSWDISFETTHHGPTVSSPVFYIEIGSYEELWDRKEAAEAIAKSILEIEPRDDPVVLCVGGGHYAPRFTEVALSRRVSVGHMAANYALEALSADMIAQMSEKSAGAKKVYFHKKGMPKPAYRELRERFATCGLEEISSEDLIRP